MPVVPFSKVGATRIPQQVLPPDQYLLMAAAQMNKEGRLVDQDETNKSRNDILNQKSLEEFLRQQPHIKRPTKPVPHRPTDGSPGESMMT